LFLALCATSAKAAAGDVPATGRAPVSTAAPMSDADLLTIDRAELRDRFDESAVATYRKAHTLLEQYFAATAAPERKQIVTQIQALNLDPIVIGRLARVRLDWPALAGGVYYVNEQIGPHRARYFIGIPKDYDRTKSLPLVIKLPTANAFVVNPPPDADQVAGIYTGWITDELTAHPDAIVLMPLLNLDELYGPSYAGMNSVIQAMLHATGRANIDPARVYMIGHSMAAHAVWDLALHYTTYFAAIAPLAGSAKNDWQRLRLANLRNVLPVVWADAGDDVVPVDESRTLVRLLKSQKIEVQYEETQGLGHAPSAEVAERVYQQMRARKRDLYPLAVTLQSNRPDTMFNRLDWVQIYQPMDPGGDHRVLFRKGSGSMVVNDSSWRVDAAIDRPNEVRVAARNVDTLRLYFNDARFDLTKPVTVFVNNKQRYQGMLQPSIADMLADELFLGRGWRYFPAMLDLDLGDDIATTRPATKPATRSTSRPAGKIEITNPDGTIRTIRPGGQP
jgi:predicted esterase